MKKFIAIMLAAAMALSLTACQKSDEASGSAGGGRQLRFLFHLRGADSG